MFNSDYYISYYFQYSKPTTLFNSLSKSVFIIKIFQYNIAEILAYTFTKITKLPKNKVITI